MSAAGKLKPCPFCGSDHIAAGSHGIQCWDCHAQVLGMGTASDLSTWNRRAAEAQVEALRKPITMQDVRLAIGEGPLSNGDVLAGVNAELRRRSALSSPLPVRPESKSPAGWGCAARRSILPEPADCDWPICGCDPQANKVIAAIEEQWPFPALEERVAQYLYAQWRGQDGYVPWVPHGNSLKQDEARSIAREALKLDFAAPSDTPANT